MPDAGPPPDDPMARTRSAVVNVLVADAVGIALSGVWLGGREAGALDVDPTRAQQLAYLGLFALILVSTMIRLRGRRRGPDGGSELDRSSRVASAVVGGLAVPLGLAYGWAAAPRLEDVGPFWVIALALGFRAIPWRRSGGSEPST